ncbi:hypothetical protein [Chroococcidiopsis sp. CCNUC1]|uniref:hypothetical protein n=1 Tax=Chroococcidiopsis sp. CCNUC1 TaxID=2653189 RepID=UPI0020229252|nr:hypothetical protein [Chroococcidiopsis sp. CCNUC1]URD48707.1 hypothetical protein M5J74_20515 [Chroococcidiopsis sp. CCNUC1]
MNKKEFNADGTLKEEAKIQLLAEGLSDAAIDDYAAGLKSQYEEWKRLDETDPEPWIEYTAEDLFSQEERKKFNPDGTLKPEYVEYAIWVGLSEGYLEQLEYKNKLEVENFNRMSETWAARGMNFGEYKMRSRFSAIESYAQRQEQVQQDIRNGEDLDSLPLSVDPDDYYQQHGYNPG